MARNPNPPKNLDERLHKTIDALIDLSKKPDLAEALGNALRSHPRALEITEDRARTNTVELAQALNLTTAQVVRLFAAAPMLLYRKPQTIRSNVDQCAKLLELPPKRVIRAAIISPTLLGFSPDQMALKVEALASYEGLDRTQSLAIYRKAPALLTLAPDTLIAKISGLAEMLDVETPRVVRMIGKYPQILARSTDNLERFVVRMTAELPCSHETLLKILEKTPQVILLRPDTAQRNIRALSEFLHVGTDQIVTAATKLPALFYLDIDRIRQKFERVEYALDLTRPELSDIVLRAPTLAGRDPEVVIRRVGIAQRIARALGEPSAPKDILTLFPSVPTYATERLLLRHLVARLGLWQGKWSSLIIMRDHTVKAKLEAHLASLPAGSLSASRLQRLIERRL